MPRYLTPPKLCLLLLIDLYLADEIPTSSKLDVLSFVASQTNAPSDNDNDSLEERLRFASSDVSTFAERLSQWQSGIPGRTLYDALLQRIWRRDDLDSLHSLFQQLNEVISPSEIEGEGPVIPKVSRASPLGQFIRRCTVEFTRLQFTDSQALWNALATYRSGSYESWASRNPEAAQQRDLDRPAWARPPQPTTHTSSSFTSTSDSDTLLSFSIHKLQTLGTRIPPTLKSHLTTWITHQSDFSAQSLQHFLAFFESWRSGQYTMALESLHRYFDYSLISRTSGDGAGGSGNESVKVYYQYALLHLSVLHADFEFWSESVDAMEECIATARENQDTGCLNFALSWLLYLRQAHPDSAEHEDGLFEGLGRLVGGGSEGDEVAFLKQKAREGKSWGLLSSTLLEEAKGDMYCVSLIAEMMKMEALLMKVCRAGVRSKHSNIFSKPHI